MDRVETLSRKLAEQLEGNASIDQLLTTVEMLRSELMHLRNITPQGKDRGEPSPAVHIATPSIAAEKKPPVQTEPEEKIVEMLQVDEAAVEAELEEIKKNAEALNQMSASNKPAMKFDPMEETPTLIQHQARKAQAASTPPAPTMAREEETSLNDKLKESRTELSDALAET
ncbi:MAG: hypothetical protein EOO02_18005, partial [Chitinophagaceae bacterium]